MKGIYCVKNGRGQIKRYYSSQDLDADKAYYDNEEYKNEKWWGSITKNNPRASLSFEVIEVTDNPEYDVLKYILPQISRIKYDQGLLDAVVYGRTKISRLKRAAEWFCEFYPTQYYSIEFYCNEKGRIFGTLKRKGEKVNLLRFSKKGGTAVNEVVGDADNDTDADAGDE